MTKRKHLYSVLEWEGWKSFFTSGALNSIDIFLPPLSVVDCRCLNEKQISNCKPAKRCFFAPVKLKLPRSCITEWNYRNKLAFPCVEARVRLVYSSIHKAVKSTFSCKSIHDGWPLFVGYIFNFTGAVLWFQVELLVRDIRWESIGFPTQSVSREASSRMNRLLSLHAHPFPTWKARSGNSILTSEPVSTAGECDLRMYVLGSAGKRNQRGNATKDCWRTTAAWFTIHHSS